MVPVASCLVTFSKSWGSVAPRVARHLRSIRGSGDSLWRDFTPSSSPGPGGVGQVHQAHALESVRPVPPPPPHVLGYKTNQWSLSSGASVIPSPSS